MAEKTEKPTSKKLKDESKKGNSFKYKELLSTTGYITGIAYLLYVADWSAFSYFYQTVLRNVNHLSLPVYIRMLSEIFFQMVLPLIILCGVSVSFVSLMQTRFAVATEAIKFDLKKIDPIAGFKRIFTKKSLKNLVKALISAIIYLSSSYAFVCLYTGDLFQVITAPFSGVSDSFLYFTGRYIFIFILLLLPLLVIDYIVEYFFFFNDMKMEKHEVKQEYKNSEGNQEIKSARKQQHRELLNAETKALIKNSDVVVVNPTHIAVAVYLDPENGVMPLITVKEKGAYALAVRRYAEKHKVPVVRDIRLARTLFRKYHVFDTIIDDDLDKFLDLLLWLNEAEQAAYADGDPQ
ncbi:EscU/YscU/HrcU family type III secretion system export apparatus switch protein [Morganella morganii]|uniref:EscU/YscU/HrcU family type III secretion system export apparatus switch protein n=1 Tax=Morganella morganii TaxID=582 RepID=UPI0024B944EB|nr:EscU/YscU/HrcU family type III secretion system export apparatus switch protein [Morganella morganii]ELB1546710.1 EscU/YscU/HrcU family type III secretion system export apparatus switch protein [Morganella morganii]BEP19657.1 SctU family type III secretion system export apparatus subunit BsaZ [Morganella morganii subsp. sibonii]HDS6843526.1 EscU/YscU/HrcU family type III secretion system export apparatus switch protein [Morganella morganii subsp. morganii]HDU8308366.1 EscU/YscU/HrcU family t